MADDRRILDWAASVLGHDFTDQGLLIRALTHASSSDQDYQRLEFLGDRVLGLAIAAWLYADFNETEGKLSRRLAELVSRETCAEVARRIDVGAHVRLGRQARSDGAQTSDNVLGDVVEALIGALYLDGGWAAANGFVRRAWQPYVDTAARAPKHPKSALQEWANGKGLPSPVYEIVARTGPHHAPIFRVRATLRGTEPVEAEGASKQEAETQAAAALLAAVSR